MACYAIEVDGPNGVVRMRARYATEAAARSWLAFVSAAWHAEAYVVRVSKGTNAKGT